MDQLIGFLGKTLVRSIVVGIILLLVVLLVDAKNDVRRAEKRAEQSEDARQKSDLALAKTERECSDRLEKLWTMFYQQKQEVETLERSVDKSLQKIKAKK